MSSQTQSGLSEESLGSSANVPTPVHPSVLAPLAPAPCYRKRPGFSQGETKRTAQSSLTQRRALFGFSQKDFYPGQPKCSQPSPLVALPLPMWGWGHALLASPFLSPNHTPGSRGLNGLHRGTLTLYWPTDSTARNFAQGQARLGNIYPPLSPKGVADVPLGYIIIHHPKVKGV